MKLDRSAASSVGMIRVVALSMLVWMTAVGAARADGVTPTNEWINLYSTNSVVDGQPLAPGTVVAVFDSQGAKCGEIEVIVEGWYGLLPCYRASVGTDAGRRPRGAMHAAADEEGLSFTVNGRAVDYVAVSLNETPVPPSTQVTWTALGDVWEVDLRNSDAPQPIGGYSVATRSARVWRAKSFPLLTSLAIGLGVAVILFAKARGSSGAD